MTNYCFYGFCFTYDEFCDLSLTYENGDNWHSWCKLDYDKKTYIYVDRGFRDSWCKRQTDFCPMEDQNIFVGIQINYPMSLENLALVYSSWKSRVDGIEFDFSDPFFADIKPKIYNVEIYTY